jgi:hypothetical protein
MLVAVEPDLVSCATCGVESGPDRPTVCPICADERQWVPASGQAWTTQAEWAATTTVTITELGPDQWGVSAAGVGIGQTMQVVRQSGEVLLWDPIGLVDTRTVAFIRSLGRVRAVVASHPHMYGAQVTWSRALDDAPVLVNVADDGWVQRRDPVLQPWSGRHALAEGLELLTLGGHFPGSGIVHWSEGTGGVGTVLAGDTMMVNADRATLSFLRSYPNRIPLSAAVVGRMADTVAGLRFEQIWSNFGNAITEGAAAKVQSSAERHIHWVNGDFDTLT